MAFVTLGEALESALASMLIDGEGATAIAPLSPKTAGTGEAPASWEEVVTTNSVVKTTAAEATQPGNAPASRAKGTGRPVHHKAPPQRRTGRPLLLVIEGGLGGRPACMGGVSRAAFCASGEEGEPARKLVLVEGGRGHAALL